VFTGYLTALNITIYSIKKPVLGQIVVGYQKKIRETMKNA
jgi:hypothetical protein